MIFRRGGDARKGWLAGPWDDSAPVVDGVRLELPAGDALVVVPGEDHTFVESGEGHHHFVVQHPFSPGDKSVSPTPREQP